MAAENATRARKAAEPGDRLLGPVEHERSERGNERPDCDGARFRESPQAPLEEEGKKQEHCDLARAIGGVALSPGEESKPDQRHDLVGEGNER